MPKGKRLPQAGTRLPSLRGVIVIDEFNGKPRTRAWPRPRGRDRSEVNQYWTRWLRAITFMWRYQPAKFQDQMMQATKDTPWMPRDPFISASRGRAWSFTDQNGRTWYPLPVRQAVSQSLDAIAQLAGSMLFRGPTGWTSIAAPPATGYVLVSTGEATAPEWVEGGPGGSSLDAWSPISPPSTASPDDDEFDIPGAGVPSGWTDWDHGGLGSVDVDDAGLVLAQASHVGTGWSGVTKPLPAGDFTIWTRLAASGNASSSPFTALALMEDPATATADFTALTIRSGTDVPTVDLNRWSAWNGTPTALKSPFAVAGFTPSAYFRIRRTGTTYRWEASADGLGWLTLSGAAPGFTPTAVGLIQSNNNSGAVLTSRASFYRYIAADAGPGQLMRGRRA